MKIIKITLKNNKYIYNIYNRWDGWIYIYIYIIDGMGWDGYIYIYIYIIDGMGWDGMDKNIPKKYP